MVGVGRANGGHIIALVWCRSDADAVYFSSLLPHSPILGRTQHNEFRRHNVLILFVVDELRPLNYTVN